MNNFASFYAQSNKELSEGMFSRALGTAALAAGLGFANSGEAAQHHKHTHTIKVHKMNPAEQQNVIARTIWAEARADGDEGMKAVASVIYNRGGGNVAKMVDVIKTPKQFSCWNKMTKANWDRFVMKQKDGKEWEYANALAAQIMKAQFIPTTDATHYFNPNKVMPSWAYASTGVLRPHDAIGDHYFMKLNA